MTCAEYIAEYLVRYGVEHFFMVSGGGAMYLNDSLGKHIPYTAHHHEQACSFAAEGYARTSGKLGVVNVTTGPGGLNCLNGLFGQWTDSVPVLYISGQVKTSTMHTLCTQSCASPLRQLGDQEVDIISIVRPLTKYAISITNPHTILYHLEKAIYEATHGRYGPVWLDIPIDIQAAHIDITKLESFTPPPLPSYSYSIDAVVERLLASKSPLIIAGHGVRLSNTIEVLEQLLTLTSIPAVGTLNGFDCLSDNNLHYIGRIGTIGQRAGNFALQNADCILCLGTRNNIRQVSYNWENFARNAYKIIIDIDEAELYKPLVQPDMPICVDLAEFMPALLNALQHKTLPQKQWEKWLSFCTHLKKRFQIEANYIQRKESINVYHFMQSLIDNLQPYDTCVLANATPTICTFQVGKIKKGQRFITNSGSASMGYALPTAIGAYYGHHGNGRVICIEGDGSLMMNLQELQTIYHYKLPIILFVINNCGYCSIKQSQRNFFQGNLTGADPTSGVSTPHFIDIAKAFQIPTLSITYSHEVKPLLQRALSSEGPLLCQVNVDPDYIFTPKLSSRILPDGTIISASLEDMFPFLDPSIIKECTYYG